MKMIPVRLDRWMLGLLCALAFAGTTRAEARPGWLDNQTAALAQARTERKLVLMNFTGSDWCPWCIQMDQEIFNTSEFRQYAKDNLVLLDVDFPQGKPIAARTLVQNENLAREYGVETFPTLIVLDPQGKPVKAFLGYQRGGAKTLVAALQKIKS